MSIYLEYQEVPEEPPMKKKLVDDASQLLSINLNDKRLSMLHHMPPNESIPYEDLKVRIPGGATEEIIIQTDFAPPTPRLSFITEESTLLPVILSSYHSKLH